MISDCVYCSEETRIAAADYGGPFWVQCDKCGMNGPYAKWQGTEEKSTDLAWERYTLMCQKAHNKKGVGYLAINGVSPTSQGYLRVSHQEALKSALVAEILECGVAVVTRKEVFEAIDSERDYQEWRWGGTASSGTPGSGRSIDEYALYITEYAAQLRHLAGTTANPTAKLSAIRKVAGLCVAAMEQHGAPKR